MPSKLQLKLISNSGELLNVVTCHAGKISVLRASSPSDLRPYQRALSGSSVKENLEVVCDGAEYRPDEHILIGFGEHSPTAGLSVKEFLTKQGISELAVDSILLSIGLESVVAKRCSELTPDQEARLRLVAATANPEKLLILNDPFEHIASQWRERTAEMLTNYARTRRALVVVPALTYRPESWIDNECIERIEVGQTSQRTIGFGSAGSQSNAMINDLRDKLRADPRFAQQESAAASPQREAAPLAAAASIAAAMDVGDLSESTTTAPRSLIPSLLKVSSVTLGVAAGGWLAVSFSHLTPTTPKSAQKPEQVALTTTKPLAPSDANPAQSSKAEAPAIKPETQPVSQTQPEGPAKLANPPADPKTDYVLDSYPAIIKASLVDTSKGVSSFGNQPSAPIAQAPAQNAAAGSGNLFSLLAQAGSNKPDPNAGSLDSGSYASDAVPAQAEEPASPAEEEQRREEIRNRFLEAIRASAARRQAAMEEDSAEE